jgi:hypothetical protein
MSLLVHVFFFCDVNLYVQIHLQTVHYLETWDFDQM